MLVQKPHLLFSAADAVIFKIFHRTVFKEPFSHDNIFYGKFNYHDQNIYFRVLDPYIKDQLLDVIHAIKALELVNPS